MSAQSIPSSFRVKMEAQKISPLSLKESNMLRQMAEIEENLEKCSKEAINLEQEIAKTKTNVATIEEYIEILASQPELCPSATKGLSWNKRIALLHKEQLEEWDTLKELEGKWIDLVHIKMVQLKNDLDALLVQERSLYETQFSAAKKSQECPYHV